MHMGADENGSLDMSMHGAEGTLLRGAEDSVALMLYRCMSFLPFEKTRLRCAVAIVYSASAMAATQPTLGRGARKSEVFRFITYMGSNSVGGERMRRHLLRGAARTVLQTAMSNSYGPNVVEQFFCGREWMRCLWDGTIWPTFREEVACIFLEEAEAMAPDCLHDLDDRTVQNFKHKQGFIECFVL